MQKIKILCDTSSDISNEMAKELDIEMFPIPVIYGDKNLRDGVDYTREEFWDVLDAAKIRLSTTHIPLDTTKAAYEKAYEEGCEAVIHVTNNSVNSGMFNTANLAKKFFFEEHPEAEGKFRIEPVDSHSFTLAYGLPVIFGARCRNNGGTVDEIVELMNEVVYRAEIYMVVYDLKFARVSGRISAAAAVVGGALGIRPIISMIHGETATVDKIRGDSKIIPRLVQCVKDNMDPKFNEFAVVGGYPQQEAAELERMTAQETGMRSIGNFKLGAAVAINVGPKAMAVVILGKDRRK